ADAKVGVTMLCQSLAETMASHFPKRRIMLLHFGGNCGIDYTESGDALSLDDLKSALLSNVLQSSEILSACAKKQDNLYQLPGISVLSSRREYEPEHIHRFLSLCQADLILIDAGANYELGLTIGALRYADSRYLIATQQAVVFDRYAGAAKQILVPLGVQFAGLILNQHIANPMLDGADLWQKRYGLPVVSTVEFSDYGWQAEKEKESLLHFRDTRYTKSMEKLMEHIAEAAGWEVERASKFSLFGGKHEKRV
ncbi:MAG: hypothetical protein PHC40_04920, partial [Eubacteriales bacterium]|nr:hypothetical protein [Eubacteriales bacterium]